MTKPALTPEEWKAKSVVRQHCEIARIAEVTVKFQGERQYTKGEWFCVVTNDGDDVMTPTEAHAIAALALHNQPFGFTREDVQRIRVAMRDLLARHPAMCGAADVGQCECSDDNWGLSDLAARIEALLPPEPVNGNQ